MIWLVVLRTSRLFPHEILLVHISVRVCVDPQGNFVIWKIYISIKIPLIPPGIELRTFRSVVQNLKPCVTAVLVLRNCTQTIEPQFNLKTFVLKLFNLCFSRRPNLCLCERHCPYTIEVYISVYTWYVVTEYEGNMNMGQYYS